MIRRLVVPALAVGLCAVGLWAICLWQAARNLDLADEARSGHPELAGLELELLRRAAGWSCPLNPSADEAVDQLLEQARAAEANNRPERALEAYRHLRYALLTSRSLWTPRADALGEADRGIAHLTAGGRGVSPALIEASLRSAAERQPIPWLALLGTLSLLGWLLVAGSFLAEAMTSGWRSAISRHRSWPALAVAAMAVWALALLAA